MTRALKIAIVGGGVGGLAAACALQARGFEVDVYEKSAELKEVGAGLQLGPNAVKVLSALGVSHELLPVACEPPDMVSLAWDTAALRYRQPLGSGAPARYGAQYLMAHRADLYDLFIRKLDPRRVHLGWSVLDVGSREQGAHARFENGREIEADVMIGADGIRSRIRQAVFTADQPRYTGQLGWRAMLPMSLAPTAVGPDRVSLREDFVGFLGPRGHVITYPIRGGEVLNFFAGYFADEWFEESWTTPSTPQDMMRAYHGWHPELLDLMSHVGDVYKWGLYDRDPLPGWAKGRIALLGDAAHPMMPTLAQGAAISIEDGMALARHIDADRADPSAALRAYSDERAPRAGRVQLQARQQYLNNKMWPSPPPLSRDWIFAHDATNATDWTPVAT